MSASKNAKRDGKPDLSLLPKVFLDQVAYAMMAGEKKYGRYNYTKGHKISELIAAAMRHLSAMNEGEDADQDTTHRLDNGQVVSHAACICANMLMILRQTELGTITDDRFTYPEIEEVIELRSRSGVSPQDYAEDAKLYYNLGEKL
jgi:hypothetical protein